MTFNYETAESVEAWLKDWEDDILQKPENIVLGRTLGNALELVLAELRSLSPEKRTKGRIERSESGWAREMLELLEEEFVNDAQGRIAMFRKHYPTEIGALEQEVRRGHFDIVGTETAITDLLHLDWNEILYTELKQELAKGKGYDRSTLRLISYMLAELALKRHRPKDLQSVPRDVFTREYTRYLLAEHGDQAVVASAALAQAFADAVDWIWKQGSSIMTAYRAVSEAKSLFDVSSSRFWHFSAYELIRMIQAQVANVQVTTSSLKSQTSEGAAPEKCDPASQRLAMFAAERYAQALYAHALHVEFKKQLQSCEDTPLVSFAHLLVDEVIEACRFGNIRTSDDDSRYRSAKHVLEESLASPFARVTSEMLPAIDWANEPHAMESLARMGNWLSSELHSIFELAPSSEPWTQEAALSASQELVCKRSFREALWDHLKPMTFPPVGRADANEAHSLATDMKRFEQMQKLWREWRDAIPAYAEMFHLFYSLPWKDLSGACLSQLVDALSQELNRPFEEWLVFYKVQGLDCAGAKWKLGEVLVYDPTVYDFGEGETFYPRAQSLENLAGICVDVKANSQFTARAKAHAWAEEALDVVSFALSVGRDLGGLNPRILPQVLEIPRTSPGYWSGEVSAPASTKPTTVKEIRPKDRQILESYDALLLQSETAASSLSEIQQLFLKAVHWYRMGRWQDDPIESFLFHWIALESMFARGERAIERLLLEQVPQIEITGRGVLGDFWLWWTKDWQAAIQSIKDCPALLSSVEQDSNFAGWDHYYHVLLDTENVVRLEQYANAAHSTSTKVIQDWTSRVKGIDAGAIKAETEQRRAASKYRLHVMYVRRNLIVHEAHSFREASDMAIYCQELQELLEKVLVAVAGEVTNPTSQCHTIEELIELANRPW
ncbi:MAG TPA: hypothetical protein PKO09_01525 [Anaerolineae bacterium]|nr:hypothetical protein [Anaerolineae bacterium]